MLLIAAAFAIAQVVVAIPYLVATVGTSEAAVAAAAAALSSDGLFLGLSEVCSGAVALGLTLLVVWLRKGPTVRDYLGIVAVPRATVLRWLLYTVLLGIALEGAAYLAKFPSVPDWMMKIFRSAGSLPLLIFALLVVAPVIEEIVFRGFLFQGLRGSWLGEAGTVLVASVVWAAIHIQYEAFYVGQVFCVGLLLGAARIRTASVIPPIAMHSLFSGVAVLQVMLEAR